MRVKIKTRIILRYMNKENLSKNQMADKCGIAYNTFATVFKGVSSLFTAHKIANTINRRLSDLIS